MEDEKGSPPDWVKNNWLSQHLAIAPIATFFATWALMYVGAGTWQWWGDEQKLMLAGQVAPFAVALYGTVMLIIERVTRVILKAARYDADIERARDEGIRIGRELEEREGRANR